MPIHLLVEGRIPVDGGEPVTFYQVLWVAASDVESAKTRAAAWLADRDDTFVGIDEEQTREIPESRLDPHQHHELRTRGVVAMSGRIMAIRNADDFEG